MAHAASNERDASLERRVGELELKMHEAHLRATSAWDAHVRDVQKKHDFWWAAFRYFAVAQLGFAIGVLFFGRR